MGEGEDSRSNSLIPGNDPVASVPDQLGGLDCSKGDLKVTELLDFRIVMGGGELSTEDGIEVDSSSSDDVLPFRIWKLWTVWFVNKRPLGCFGIDSVDFDEFECFGEGVS